MKIFIFLVLIAVVMSASVEKNSNKNEATTKAPPSTTTSKAYYEAVKNQRAQIFAIFAARKQQMYAECKQKNQNTPQAKNCELIKFQVG